MHGLACSILLPHVIRYNGQVPTKLSVWPKYNHYCADKKYQDIAKLLGLKADTPEQGVESLAKACEDLAKDIGLATCFKDTGIDKDNFYTHIDRIAVLAFEDQCSPCNPRVPLVEDMKVILKEAYEGK